MLAKFAVVVAPVSLEDIRSTWKWKTNVLSLVSNVLDRVGGPIPRREHELQVVRNNPSLVFLAWTIYGELFDHSFCLNAHGRFAPLDCVTRFVFLIYCVTDVNFFSYQGLQPPEWSTSMDDQSGEKFQQLGLNQAMQDYFNPPNFARNIEILTDIYLHSVLFVQVVMNSGRRSLDVLQFSDPENGSADAETVAEWL